MPPVLVKALLRYWFRPDFALAAARVKLVEAEATECPHLIREWRRAVMWLEWIAGRPTDPVREPSSKEIQLVIEEEENNRRFHGPNEQLPSRLGLDLLDT